MMRYMQALVKVVVKNPLLWVVILACQLMLLAPFVKGDDTMGYFLGKEELQAVLREAQKSMEDGTYDSAPQEERDRARERISLLTRATLTEDPREYAELRAEMLEDDIEAFRAGSLIGPTEKSLESKHRFFTLLSQQSDPRIYQTYREAPALFYVAGAYSSLPLIMWLLPSVLLAASLNRAVRGKRLLAQVPLGNLAALVAQAVVLALLSVASIALIALPSFVVPALCNGWGEATYPVVNVLGQTEVAVVESTVGQVIPRAFAMLSIAALFVAVLAHAIARMVPRRLMLAGPVAALVLLSAPLVSAYMQMGVLSLETRNPASGPTVDVCAPFNPLSYLNDYMNVAGRANYWPNQFLLADERLTLGAAVLCLLGWALVLLAAAATVLALRGRLLARKDAASAAASSVGLKAQGIVLAYGKHQVLAGASCEVLPGAIMGLIAPNGAGKTTLLEALVALGPTRRAGSVHANGIASAQPAFRKQVLYVPCDAGLLYPNLTAADHIKLASALWPDKVDARKLIELCGLEGYLDKPVRVYSSGMKQQLALAVAYCTGARYLLLDEPMNALDPGNVALNTYILKRLASQGTSVLLSSHILANLDELCDSVLAVKDGRLVRTRIGGEDGSARDVYERMFGSLRVHGERGGKGTRA